MKTPHEQPRMDAKVPWEADETIDGRVVEVALGVVSASFGPDGKLLLVGDTMQLVLAGEGIGGAMQVAVEVSETCPWQDGFLVAFRFRVEDEFSEFMAAGGGKWFNRRRDFRVNPLHAEPVTLTVKPRLAEAITLRALNLSASGVSFCVNEQQDDAFDLGDRVRVVLTLPGEQKPFELATVVRYRGQTAGKDVIGLEFDAKESRRFYRTEDALVGYIMKRQRQMLSSAS